MSAKIETIPTLEELDALEALDRTATPGPWAVETVRTQVGLCHKIGGGWPERYVLGGTREQYACIYEDGGDPRNPGLELHSNAKLFAAARNALPSLIAGAREMHRLREMLGDRGHTGCRECGGHGFVKRRHAMILETDDSEEIERKYHDEPCGCRRTPGL